MQSILHHASSPPPAASVGLFDGKLKPHTDRLIVRPRAVFASSPQYSPDVLPVAELLVHHFVERKSDFARMRFEQRKVHMDMDTDSDKKKAKAAEAERKQPTSFLGRETRKNEAKDLTVYTKESDVDRQNVFYIEYGDQWRVRTLIHSSPNTLRVFHNHAAMYFLSEHGLARFDRHTVRH